MIIILLHPMLLLLKSQVFDSLPPSIYAFVSESVSVSETERQADAGTETHRHRSVSDVCVSLFQRLPVSERQVTA